METPAVPRSAIEATVIDVFGEVLGRPEVRATDDFFALGGNSLAATMVVSRLLDAFGVELGIEQVFENPTPAGLVTAIEAALAEA